MLYSTLKPGTAVIVGSVKAAAQVLSGEVITGAVGKITTFTVLLTTQEPVPAVPAVVDPQSAVST